MFGVGVSCHSFVVYLYVNGNGSITSVGEERANLSAFVHLKLCALPLVLGMGYLILLWHSLSLPYNYFEKRTIRTIQIMEIMLNWF